MKKIISGFFMSLLFVSITGQAGIFTHFTHEDHCANLSGIWKGYGLISAKVGRFPVKCEYTGTAIVTETGDHTYNTSVDLALKSGDNVCPKDESYIIPGTCNGSTGSIKLKSNDVDLMGKVENKGTKALLKGTVTISVRNQTLTANVDEMVLLKQ